MISFSIGGSTDRTKRFLQKVSDPGSLYASVERYAVAGMLALRENTPVDSGVTADSWGYEIEVNEERCSITWTNTNRVNGANVVILLQYGHATGTGGYVTGQDFINPALRSIFDDIADNVWREVTSA